MATLTLLFVMTFTIDALADYLNLRTSRKPLPPHLEAVQSPADQKRASKYLQDRVFLGWAKSAVTLLAFLGFLYGGGFGGLQTWVQSLSDSELIQALLYIGVFSLARGLLQLPFAAYSTFTIEARYGFNRTTWRIFMGDRIKGLIVGAILGGLIFSFVMKMYGRFPEDAFWRIWLGYTAFQFFIVWIAPVTLLPLFLKLSPLPEGQLRDSIEGYRKKQDFKLDGAWVCDASKRSAKSNAFFTGFGKFRRLVLFDTLITQHPPAEITAIVAHEAGHFKLGHIWKGAIVSALTSLVLFYFVQELIAHEGLYRMFGAEPGNLGIGIFFAIVLLDQINFFFSPLTSYLSRRNEYAADRFSIETTGDVQALSNGLKRLVTDNLATLQHHPLYVILNDSHPPLPDRIAALKPR